MSRRRGTSSVIPGIIIQSCDPGCLDLPTIALRSLLKSYAYIRAATGPYALTAPVQTRGFVVAPPHLRQSAIASEIMMPRPTARNIETWKVVFMSVAEYDFAA